MSVHPRPMVRTGERVPDMTEDDCITLHETIPVSVGALGAPGKRSESHYRESGMLCLVSLHVNLDCYLMSPQMPLHEALVPFHTLETQGSISPSVVLYCENSRQ